MLQIGVSSLRKGRVAAFRPWLGVTILLGLCFLALQIYDYVHLTFSIRDGIFPSLFYVMTGLHMAHVIGGVVFLSIVLIQSWTGQLSLRRHEPVEAAAAKLGQYPLLVTADGGRGELVGIITAFDLL